MCALLVLLGSALLWARSRHRTDRWRDPSSSTECSTRETTSAEQAAACVVSCFAVDEQNSSGPLFSSISASETEQ